MIVLIVTQAAWVIVDHLLQRRHFFGHAEQLVDLLLIFNGREPDLCMAKHISHLFGNRICIDGNRNSPERLGCHHGPVEPWPV